MTLPNPAHQPADRELVEAWGVRDADGDLKGDIYDWRSRAAWDCEVYGVAKHTVVPLIAADRLTDDALVAAVTAAKELVKGDSGMTPTARVLAALRAHLEGK